MNNVFPWRLGWYAALRVALNKLECTELRNTLGPIFLTLPGLACYQVKACGQQDILSTQLIMLSWNEILTENLWKVFFFQQPMKHDHGSFHLYPAAGSSCPSWKSTGTALHPKLAVSGCEGDEWMSLCLWRWRMAVGRKCCSHLFCGKVSSRL